MVAGNAARALPRLSRRAHHACQERLHPRVGLGVDLRLGLLPTAALAGGDDRRLAVIVGWCCRLRCSGLRGAARFVTIAGTSSGTAFRFRGGRL